MRLIDADALLSEWAENPPSYDMSNVINSVKDFPTVSGWISVKDRVPDKGQDVLLQFPSNMAVGNFDHGVWFVNSGGNWNTDVCEADGDELPTHWMPLPEPQKEGK